MRLTQLSMQQHMWTLCIHTMHCTAPMCWEQRILSNSLWRIRSSLYITSGNSYSNVVWVLPLSSSWCQNTELFNYLNYLLFHRCPTHKLCFLSYRPFVVNATFSTDLVVSSVSWLQATDYCNNCVSKFIFLFGLGCWSCSDLNCWKC